MKKELDYIEKESNHFKNFYCKVFKTSCDVCHSNCENGELDCVKCSDSIEIKINE